MLFLLKLRIYEQSTSDEIPLVHCVHPSRGRFDV